VLPATVRRCLEALLGISVAAVPVIAPVGPWVGAAMADQPRPAPTWSAPSLDRPVVSPPRTSRARPIRSTGYVVRTGDCLWTIAAQHTRSRSSSVDIAATWPQWYAANERVIGPNPNLIRPGQHLAVPTEAREVSS
jgi:nucleoid-associated protein YgaU